MAYQLAKKIADLTPYEPIQGEYQVRLDANESYLNPFERYGEEIQREIAAVAFNRYPDPYCEALCRLAAPYFGVLPQQITVGNGSDELISLLVSCFLQKGEPLVTLSPDFSMYRFYGALYEAPNQVVEKRADLTVDVDALLAAAHQAKAGAILFSNPCNPTSLVLSRDEVERIVAKAPGLVVVDEAYMDFSKDQSVLGLIGQYDNLVVLKTCSKAIGLAAVRLGFAFAGEPVTRALRAVKSPYNVNSLTQAVGRVLFRHPDYLKSCLQEVLASKQQLEALLQPLAKPYGLVIYPSSTNFLFIRCPQAKAVYEALLQRSIAVRCMGDYLRICAGRSEENRQLAGQLQAVLTQLTET